MSTLGNLNDNNLLNMITLASNLCKNDLVLFGDFNLPNIDWDNMTAPGNELNFNNRFLKNLFENDLIQHVSENLCWTWLYLAVRLISHILHVWHH